MKRWMLAIVVLGATACHEATSDAPAAAPEPSSPTPAADGFVLKAGGGEALLNGIVVKASPLTGTMGSILVEQTFPRGGTTNLHIHDQGDELFYVVSGRGTANLGELTQLIEPGDVIFVPRTAVHGISNLDNDEPLKVVFFMDSPELVEEFRAIHTRVTAEPDRPMTPEERAAIRSRVGGSRAANIEAKTGVRELDSARKSIDATGFVGTVVVLDLNEGAYVAGHAERIDRRLIPASTFKIFNSLVAFETGIVADPQTVLEWDGVSRGRTELNRDLDMQTAFRISAVPHFQELARRIGPERMQHYMDLVGYGNGDISGGIDMFWLQGGLRISPREQAEFLERLYRGTLPFSPEAMAKVKQIMESERTSEHTIRSKTGLAVLSEQEHVGWWVGWVERESGVHVFASALEATSPDVDTFVATRQSLAREVLGRLGVLETSH